VSAPYVASTSTTPSATSSSSSSASTTPLVTGSVPSGLQMSGGGLQMPANWQPPTDSGSAPAGFFVGDNGSPSSGAYASGPRLIQLSGDPTVYWVSPNNLKIPMLSAKVFLSYNNKWSDIATVQQDEFDYYQAAKYIWLNGTGAIYKINISNGTKQQ